MFSLVPFIEANNAGNLEVDAVMVNQNGITLGLHRFTDDIFHNVFSVSKSFTSTAIGMAIDDGLMSLDDKPCDYFPELVPDDVDPRWFKVTLRHLMTMTVGHGSAQLMAKDRAFLRGETDVKPDPEMAAEWLRWAFTRPMEYEPGERFVYSNLAPYTAGRMLEKVTGKTMLDFLYERLWKPMEVEKPRWDPDNAGHTFPASYLFLDIADMIKLGELYLGGGVYKGRRYVSEDWVKLATSNIVSSSPISPTGVARDEDAGYGMYFWQNAGAEGYRASGREAQAIIVLPEHNAVIAVQAMHHDIQQVMDAVWDTILPQL